MRSALRQGAFFRVPYTKQHGFMIEYRSENDKRIYLFYVKWMDIGICERGIINGK